MIENRIDRLGHLGDGITETGEFVPFTLPDEEIRQGPPLEILKPSPARIDPVCRHFGTCGGCALQHADDAFLATWKADVIRRALLAQGLDIAIPPAMDFPEKTRRRATFAGRRTKKATQVGFHARGSDQIVAIEDCHLIVPEMLSLRPALEALTRIAASRKGQLRLSVSASETGWDVDVSAAKPLEQAMLPGLSEIVDKHNLARLSWDGEVVILNHQPVVRFDDVPVSLPTGAFLQASKPAEIALIAAIKAALGGAGKIVDLFAGCGTFSLSLASDAEILAVETSEEMLAALAQAWRNTSGLKSVATQTRDLFKRPLQVAEFAGYQAVVIDPPRAGAEAQSKLLAESGVPVIASVSCNPVSFARDAAILVAGGYNMDWVRAIDQFRWSPHIEIVARFSK